MTAPDHSNRPVFAAILGIALFAAMDAVMKGGALAIGAYSAFLLRCLIGTALVAPIWWWTSRRFPRGRTLRIHIVRGTVISFMGWSFFASLVRLPLAEAIAISFIAPLIALYLARLLLNEIIRPRAIFGTLMGLAGVLVIVGGRVGTQQFNDEAAMGIGLVMVSAVLFAWNLILQRQQAMVSSPLEASAFQNGVVTLVLGLGSPFLLVLPDRETFGLLTLGSVLAIFAAMLFTWAYARSETQRLVPIEYTGFLWAALFGWLFFAEPIQPLTVAGAGLIVIGCWTATKRRTEQTAL